MFNQKKFRIFSSVFLLCTMIIVTENAGGACNSLKGKNVHTGLPKTSYSCNKAIKILTSSFNNRRKKFYSMLKIGEADVNENEVLTIDRSNFFEDSCYALKNQKCKFINIRFSHGTNSIRRETKEWFSILSSKMINDEKCIFLRRFSRNDSTLEINPNAVDIKSLERFKFFGKVTGLAIFNQQMLTVCFSVPLLQSILKYEIENNKSTKKKSAELHRSVQLDAFMKGFNEIIPQNLIKMFNAEELQKLICGIKITNKNAKEWKNYVTYVGYTKNSKAVTRFWTMVDTMTDLELSRLLEFITGVPRLPPGGFKELDLKIEYETDNEITYCMPGNLLNTLFLPLSTSEEELRDQLKEGMVKQGFLSIVPTWNTKMYLKSFAIESSQTKKKNNR